MVEAEGCHHGYNENSQVGRRFKTWGVAKTFKTRSRRAKNPELDEFVLQKFRAMYEKAYEITPGHLVSFAKEYSREHGLQFKALNVWLHRFTLRQKLRYRHVTTSGHVCPHDGKSKYEAFMKEISVKNARRGIVVGAGQMGNADQVPLFFAMPNKKSLVPVGAKQVAAKTTGHTKARFTTHLFVVDYGWTEELLIFFKGLKVPEDCRD